MTYFPRALRAVQEVMQKNAPRKGDSWLRFGSQIHAEHALRHLESWKMRAPGDAHLEHAATRALMALEMDRLVHGVPAKEPEPSLVEELAAWIWDEASHGTSCRAQRFVEGREPERKHAECDCGLRDLVLRLEEEGLL